jgi:hypothetical protein
MNDMRAKIARASLAVLLGLPVAAAAAPTEIKGAAILDHACGKASVKYMTLVNAGKMEEAVKLGTAEMQKQWKAMSAADQSLLSGMVKDHSFSEADFSAQIKADGVLTVDGATASLTLKREVKEASGSSSTTMTQKFQVDGATCKISR